jgi:hypothetical protein
MPEKYEVQQRRQRDWQWVTVAVYEKRAAADGVAEGVRATLRESKHEATTKVRVVSASELAREKVLARAATETLRRSKHVQ